MDDDERRERSVRALVRAADRLESLAETAELMGDDDGAAGFRDQASQRRLQAMALLDRRPADAPPPRDVGDRRSP